MNIRDWLGSVDSRILIEEFDSFWNEVLVLFFCAGEEKRIRRSGASLGHFRNDVRTSQPVCLGEIIAG
jgi:hypothetical protein